MAARVSGARRWAWLGAAATVAGCGEGRPATFADVTRALAAAGQLHQADAVASDLVEIASQVTVGVPPLEAAAALGAFWTEEIGCGVVTVDQVRVTIDHGDQGCVVAGLPVRGRHAVIVRATDPLGVRVDHELTDLARRDGVVNGTIDVAWVDAAPARTFVSDWSVDLPDDVAFDVSGEHVEEPLEPGLGLRGGVLLTGERFWVVPSGTWQLRTEEGVQVVPERPVPVGGSWNLYSPSGQSLDMTFTLLDDGRIEVVAGGDADTRLHVLPSGEIEEQ